MVDGQEVNYVKSLTIIGTEKKRDPEKFYVYSMRLTRKNGSISVIYRRYSEFFEMHCEMIEEYRELVTSKPRWLPPLPKGGIIGRGNVSKVAEARLEPLREYVAALMKLDKKYISSEIMEEFFKVNEDDLRYAQVTKSEDGNEKTINIAENVGGPVILEEYIALENYKPKDKKGVSLVEGEVIEVIDKNNSGWWYVTWSGGIGWVPANYLAPVEGEEEEYKVCSEDNFYITISNFKSSGRDEISFNRGEIVTVQLISNDGWWYVCVAGKKGFAPSQYLHKLEGDVLKEDLVKNPPDVNTIAADPIKGGQAPPPRSNTHRRKSTRKAQKSMRTRRAPKMGSLPEGPPEGDNYIVVESYSASGIGQVTLGVGDKVVVTNKAKEDWWYVWKDGAQGWFPAAFLISESKIKEPEKYKVISDYVGSSKEELTAKKGQIVVITDQMSDTDWWFGNVGKVEGWIPAAFLQNL